MAKKPSNTVTVKWETRKRLAINAFRALLIYTLIYWFLVPYVFTYYGILQSTVLLGIIQESYSWFAITMIGVIFAYMGFTTLPFIGKGGTFGKYNQRDDTSEQSDTETESYVDPNYKFRNEDL